MSNYNKALKETKQDVEEWYDLNNWEDVPTEELWEDGEMSKIDVKEEIFWRVITMGNWILIRRKNE